MVGREGRLWRETDVNIYFMVRGGTHPVAATILRSFSSGRDPTMIASTTAPTERAAASAVAALAPWFDDTPSVRTRMRAYEATGGIGGTDASPGPPAAPASFGSAERAVASAASATTPVGRDRSASPAAWSMVAAPMIAS